MYDGSQVGFERANVYEKTRNEWTLIYSKKRYIEPAARLQPFACVTLANLLILIVIRLKANTRYQG